MPSDRPLETRLFAAAAEVLELRQQLAEAEGQLESVLQDVPAPLAQVVRECVEQGTKKISHREDPPDLRSLLDFIQERPGCSTRHLAQRVYGSTERVYVERIRGRLNHAVQAQLVEKGEGKDGGWRLTERGIEVLEEEN